MLTRLPTRAGARQWTQQAFAGLDRRPAAAPGAITQMENCSCAAYPALTTRPPRTVLRALHGTPHGLCAVGRGLLSAEGTQLYFNDAPVPGALTDTDKRFAVLGRRVLIFPDKLLFDADGAALSPLESSVTLICTVADGSYAGAPAEGNTLRAADAAFDWAQHFAVGDAVTVSGASAPENNKTAVVREVSGRELRFSEHCFTPGAQSETLTVSRTMPDLAHLCVCDNRVWGCRGDSIFCSKLGDPFNWNVFDGLSTDAWSVESGTAGDFTGCAAFLGSPVFFKEARVFKVYGSRPGNYELTAGASQGLLQGAHGTLCAAGEALYYLSPAGFVRFGGGFPAPVDAPLHERYTGGAAAGDGRRYFVFAERAGGARENLVYDPQRDAWQRADALPVRFACCVGGTVTVQTDDALLALGAGEEDFTASVTVGGLGAEGLRSGYPARLWLALENAAPVTVSVAYDGGTFTSVGTLSPLPAAAPRALALPTRRHHRMAVRLSGPAPWTLHALGFETRAGNANRR